MWSIQSPPLPLDAGACSSDFSVPPPTPGVAPLLTRDGGILLRRACRAQIYRRRTGVRLEFDTRVFLDLLVHEALGKVLKEIDSEAAGGFCALLGFRPHLGTADRIQKVMSVPAQASKSHALHWLCSGTLDKAGLLQKHKMIFNLITRIPINGDLRFVSRQHGHRSIPACDDPGRDNCRRRDAPGRN